MEDNQPHDGGTPNLRSTGNRLPPGHLIRRGVWPLLLTYALLPATFLCPAVDSTTAPFLDLTSLYGTTAHWAAQSGGTVGAPLIAALMLVLLITRRGLTGRRRTVELLLIVFVVALCAGGGAALNEHGVKAALRVPRPNIVYLAGPDGSGPLGMTAEAFYGVGDKAARRAPLRSVLEAEPPPVSLAPAVREHWIEETGYSFPSGHAFSAMFIATFFLATAITYISTPRLWFFYLLLPWALAVGYSRPILRVHTPADITAGGLEGLLFGLIAFLVVQAGLTAYEKAH